MSQLERDVAAQRVSSFAHRGVEPTEGVRRAAVAVIVAEIDGVRGIWLTRRPTRLRDHPGQFALPGGRLEAGEDAVDAALRETEEEIGVHLGPDAVLGLLDDYLTRSGYVMTPVVCWAGAGHVPTPSADEVAHLYFIPLSDLTVDPIFLRIPESDRPVIQLPLLGHRIHAPTAAVLYQFAEVVLAGRDTRVDQLEQPVFAWH